MHTPWDDSLKIFISENPQDFVSWLFPGAQVKKKLLTEFKTRTIEADALIEAILNEKDILVHYEFQSTNDPMIGERLLAYNFEARREHKLPVYSCVIYLRSDSEVPKSPLRWTLPNSQEVLQFHYRVIELARLSTKALRQTGLVGLLPLLILTEDGATYEVLEEVITRIEAANKPELLPITQLLASLVFTSESDKTWILWRFSKMRETLRNTWAYQEMTKESREEGKREALRGTLVAIVQARFPKLMHVTKALAATTENTEVLQSLILKMTLAHTVEEAQASLFEVGEEGSN